MSRTSTLPERLQPMFATIALPLRARRWLRRTAQAACCRSACGSVPARGAADGTSASALNDGTDQSAAYRKFDCSADTPSGRMPQLTAANIPSALTAGTSITAVYAETFDLAHLQI